MKSKAYLLYARPFGTRQNYFHFEKNAFMIRIASWLRSKNIKSVVVVIIVVVIISSSSLSRPKDKMWKKVVFIYLNQSQNQPVLCHSVSVIWSENFRLKGALQPGP
jgi:hypothetical protein